MAYLTHYTQAPFTGSRQRYIARLYATQTDANTAADGDRKVTAYDGSVSNDAEIGALITILNPGKGNVSKVLTLTADRQRKLIVEESAEWADDLCELLSPTLYIRAGAQNAEAVARYAETRARIISAPAVMQAAARAGWTPTVMRGLLNAQKQLQPPDPRQVRRFFRQHNYSASHPPGSWTAAIHTTGGSQQIHAIFPASSSARDTDTWDPLADAQTPTIWNTTTGGRLVVPMSKQADPTDFSTV